MQNMHEPVCDGRQQYGSDAEKSYPAEQCVKRGEQFGRIAVHGVHRAHPCQYHGGVVKGVYPGYVSKRVVPQRPYRQRNYDKQERNKEVAQNPQ
jgi:hypothetical protein